MDEKLELCAYEHEGMRLDYVHGEQGLAQIGFNPTDDALDVSGGVPFPNYQLAVAGRPYGFMQASVAGYTSLPLEMCMVAHERTADGLRFRYAHTETGLAVEIEMRFVPGAAVVRQWTRIVNGGDRPQTLTHLSSLCMQGIAMGGCRPWNAPGKIKVHYCRQTWEGEGQWRQGDLEELGLIHTSVHPCGSAVRLGSVGSWSTANYLPMVVVEDCETHCVWYAQIEISATWHLEIGYRSSWSDERGGLYIHADAADERHGNWAVTLAPGEQLAVPPAAIGCCRGGFGEAIRQLTRYRRRELLPAKAWPDECPVAFNDYMNCLWGNPTREKLLPLIEAAASVGAEIFCIDAGWFGGLNESWGTGLGDWEPSRTRFGPEGLQGILDHIRGRGLIPGVWLEMEVCSSNSALGRKPDDWFLLRHGQRVGGGARWFLDFTHPEVRAHLHGVIDRLVAMGVGYIKNDYNECIGPGDDHLGSSAGEGLLRHVEAFYAFIDEVRRRHPRLILENCGSGAMRADYGILSHFHLQSSSDQELYTRYPAIIVGSLAAVVPEQLGIWAYPYPLLFKAMGQPESLESKAYRQQMADGEETIFNMVNGLCGNLYLSGRIDCADALNTNLICEAVALYKRERPFIRQAYPTWPIGMARFNAQDAWASVGLAAEDGSRVLLAVWRLGSNESCQTLPLPGWAGRAAHIRQLYPAELPHAESYYCQASGELSVHLLRPYQARLFEVCAL